MTINVGTAGWTIPRTEAAAFPEQGSSLERYAARLGVAEINSSFHRPHRASTWARWRDAVPDHFRFSAKLPKTITHQQKLQGCEALLDGFVEQVGGLGEKLAVLLVQLPPKLAFEEGAVRAFLLAVRARTRTDLVVEPRHASWFSDEVDAFFADEQVASVGADPAILPAASTPGGSRKLAYLRLHGSPQIYRSSYADRLPHIAASLRKAAEEAQDCWCIFDNTASSAAMGDALALNGLLAA